VVTNAVVELVDLSWLSVFTFTSAVNLVNLSARLGNHQHIAVVHNFDGGARRRTSAALLMARIQAGELAALILAASTGCAN